MNYITEYSKFNTYGHACFCRFGIVLFKELDKSKLSHLLVCSTFVSMHYIY